MLLIQVIAAGSPAQVASALEAAGPLKEKLMERGVLVVPLPIFEGNAAPEIANDGSAAGDADSDLRWGTLGSASIF